MPTGSKLNRLNKTEVMQIPMTRKLDQAIRDCAKKLGLKHTEWVRHILANAVQVECLRPTPQEQEQEQTK